jgi:hypothetical protein
MNDWPLPTANREKDARRQKICRRPAGQHGIAIPPFTVFILTI